MIRKRQSLTRFASSLRIGELEGKNLTFRFVIGQLRPLEEAMEDAKVER